MNDERAQKEVEEFFSHYPVDRYPAGTVVLRADESPTSILYLKLGYVKQYLISPKGETMVIHIFKPGSFFPLTSVLNLIPNTSHFEAVDEILVQKAPKETVRTFLRAHPVVLYALTTRLLTALGGLTTRLESHVFGSAYERTAVLFAYFARSFGVEAQGSVTIPLPLSHREVATWLGTARETASLQIEALMKKGLLRVDKRLFIVPDLVRLEKEGYGNQ